MRLRCERRPLNGGARRQIETGTTHLRGHTEHEAVVKGPDVPASGNEVGQSIGAQAGWRGAVAQDATDVLLKVFGPLQGEEG
jgi:hypothetical protein